jgi:hypothetical protein
VIGIEAGDGQVPFHLKMSVEGMAIYLDNFAVIGLAKGDAVRRARFINVLRGGGAEILFSVANAVELVGPEGRSRELVMGFLREIGRHWFPVKLNTFEACDMELKGIKGGVAFTESDLAKTFFRIKVTQCGKHNKLIVFDDNFFGLDALVEWLATGKDRLVIDNKKLDETLHRKIMGYRAEIKRDPSWIDRSFQELPFRSDMPATFVYVNLIRNLLRDRGFRVKQGDGMDFCHAVFGSAFASIATLDRLWKRRVEDLPEPNKLARIYYKPELDQMVEDLELACAKYNAARAQGITPGIIRL